MILNFHKIIYAGLEIFLMDKLVTFLKRSLNLIKSRNKVFIIILSIILPNIYKIYIKIEILIYSLMNLYL